MHCSVCAHWQELIALRAIRDVNVPKFLMDDLKLFNGIVSDLFPNIQWVTRQSLDTAAKCFVFYAFIISIIVPKTFVEMFRNRSARSRTAWRYEVVTCKINKKCFRLRPLTSRRWAADTLPYLTLPSGWAGCYTCPALRPYQFGPMRNPDVTRRSQ